MREREPLHRALAFCDRAHRSSGHVFRPSRAPAPGPSCRPTLGLNQGVPLKSRLCSLHQPHLWVKIWATENGVSRGFRSPKIGQHLTLAARRVRDQCITSSQGGVHFSRSRIMENQAIEFLPGMLFPKKPCPQGSFRQINKSANIQINSPLHTCLQEILKH